MGNKFVLAILIFFTPYLIFEVIGEDEWKMRIDVSTKGTLVSSQSNEGNPNYYILRADLIYQVTCVHNKDVEWSSDVTVSTCLTTFEFNAI